MIDISAVTYEDLRAGKYEKELPELYELKNTIEHSLPFHDRQPVFDHILEVFKSLRELLKLDFVNNAERKGKIENHLNKRIGNFTRRELLLQASLLHDIAKDIAVKELPDGRLVCPKHDEAGAGAVKDFKSRFGWTENDMTFVKGLIKRHLTMADLIDEVWKEPARKDATMNKIKAFCGESCLEDLLLGWADSNGLDLKTLDPGYLKSRADVCREMILNEIEL